MIIGIGKSPFANFIKKYTPELVGTVFYPYPMFFDDKKDLLEGHVKEYIIRLTKNMHQIKIALYPDYQDENLPLPRNITYIYPVHSLTEYEKFQRVKRKFQNVYVGYASDPKYRDYELCDFLKTFRGEKIWYLGVSTKRELEEALHFDAMDVTGFMFGNHSDRTNKDRLLRNIKNFVKEVERKRKRDINCQTSIFDYLK